MRNIHIAGEWTILFELFWNTYWNLWKSFFSPQNYDDNPIIGLSGATSQTVSSSVSGLARRRKWTDSWPVMSLHEIYWRVLFQKIFWLKTECGIDTAAILSLGGGLAVRIPKTPKLVCDDRFTRETFILLLNEEYFLSDIETYIETYENLSSRLKIMTTTRLPVFGQILPKNCWHQQTLLYFLNFFAHFESSYGGYSTWQVPSLAFVVWILQLGGHRRCPGFKKSQKARCW